MKICPHCKKDIPLQYYKKLKLRRSILCPRCSKGVRYNQKTLSLQALVIGGIAGILGHAFYKISALEVMAISVIFSTVYAFVFLKYLGRFYSLEKADDDDLLI